MTDKHKAQFELINESLWLLLKKYVKDDKPYKEIMKDLFKLYIAYDISEKRFTDEWWEEAIKKFMDYPQKYKDSELKDFAGDLAIGFCDVWEREKKLTIIDNVDFYRCVCKTFLKEWGRLKNGKEDS